MAVATEWEDEKGESSLILIRLRVSEGQGTQFWKNDQGEYIKSDDRSYNPNRDSNVNNQDWTEMEEQR